MQAPAGSEDPAPQETRTPRWHDFTDAQVLASPGLPATLRRHLPTDKIHNLRWPLPQGPILIVGLPSTDPDAADLADALGLLPWGETLGGGYALHVWHDGTRPIGVLLADDPAGLLAARFAFVADADPMALDPAMRPVAVGQPDSAARVFLREGRRGERPQSELRILRTNALPRGAAWATLLGARVNRVWLDEVRAGASPPRDRWSRYGIGMIPCLAWHGRTTHQDFAKQLAQTASAWRAREFAVRCADDAPLPWHAVEAIQRSAPEHVERLFIDGPAVAIGEDAPGTHVEVVWLTGRDQMAAHITDCGTLRQLTWAEVSLKHPTCAAVAPPPWQRAAPSEYVVARGRVRHAAALLATTWRAPERVKRPFTRVLPAGLSVSSTAWEQAADALRALGRRHGATAPALAVAIDAARTTLSPAQRVVVPCIPRVLRADGALTEPAWRHAVDLPLDVPDQRLFAVSDGWSLWLGWRGARESEPLLLVLGDARVRVRGGVAQRRGPSHAGPVHHAASAPAGSEGALRLEMPLSRRFLGVGDAHPGQVIPYAVYLLNEEGHPRTQAHAEGALLIAP